MGNDRVDFREDRLRREVVPTKQERTARGPFLYSLGLNALVATITIVEPAIVLFTFDEFSCEKVSLVSAPLLRFFLRSALSAHELSVDLVSENVFGIDDHR
jgi:hypothetical protein